mgnify:CR=1 FL=1
MWQSEELLVYWIINGRLERTVEWHPNRILHWKSFFLWKNLLILLIDILLEAWYFEFFSFTGTNIFHINCIHFRRTNPNNKSIKSTRVLLDRTSDGKMRQNLIHMYNTVYRSYFSKGPDVESHIRLLLHIDYHFYFTCNSERFIGSTSVPLAEL